MASAGTDSLPHRILACVESIPAGRVMSYGDVAEFVGSRSARIVGRVLAMDGGTVPWHRVIRSDGTLADHLYSEQRQRLLAEGVRFDGDKVRIADHRWDGR
ncbi:MAG TPA: MGMT family protein [Jatrophihabitantaceae bacterium]|nr:MGMT family protein [Jatrophihabitantaceae bacterium]